MRRLLRTFLIETEGAILVFWAMTLVAILGIVALSFDVGRLATTHSELQAYADNVAMAAAGELDGKSDAISRATSAAAGMVNGTQTFADGSQTLSGATDYTLAFYPTLPANDETALGTATTDPAKAQFVSVTVTPHNLSLTFARVVATLLGKPQPTALMSATAVAGFNQYACDVTPMMFCAPPGFKADAHIGEMILLRSGGSGAAWQPGDFGFLDPRGSGFVADPGGPCYGLSGNNYFQCLLGAEGNITQCFSERGVNTEPGQKVGIENAIWNVRFDIFESSMNHATNATYPAAPNVIKGVVPKGGSSCIGSSGGNASMNPDSPTPQDTMALPRDSDISTNRFGNGSWDRAGYIAMNWPDGAPAGWNTTSGTRWQLYNAEIAAGGGAAETTPILTGKNQTGRPMCTAHQSSYPERRMIVAAAVDCGANPISGSATNVPVSEFVKLFLTESVGADSGSSNSVDIYAEVVGTAEGVGGAGGKGGLFRDVVQLYR